MLSTLLSPAALSTIAINTQFGSTVPHYSKLSSLENKEHPGCLAHSVENILGLGLAHSVALLPALLLLPLLPSANKQTPQFSKKHQLSTAVLTTVGSVHGDLLLYNNDDEQSKSIDRQ